MRVIVVDRDSDEAVYLQISNQIRSGIALGELPPGLSLPSVRTIASDLGVSLNTVARAYRELEGEGFLVIRNRRGAEVASPAEAPAGLRRGELTDDLRRILCRMHQAGFSVEGIQDLIADMFAADRRKASEGD